MPKEATREKKIRRQESQEETGGDSDAIALSLASKLTGVASDASRRSPGPRGQPHTALPYHIRSSRRELPGGRKKPRTIILLTAGSSSQLISIRDGTLSR